MELRTGFARKVGYEHGVCTKIGLWGPGLSQNWVMLARVIRIMTGL